MRKKQRQSVLDDPNSKRADHVDEISRMMLDHIYKEAAKEGEVLRPDTAIERMTRLARDLTPEDPKSHSGIPLRPGRLNLIAARRRAHHYAVDLFYRTHFPQKGAPRIHPGEISLIRELQAKGLGYSRIGKVLSLSKDTVRKRIQSNQRA